MATEKAQFHFEVIANIIHSDSPPLPKGIAGIKQGNVRLSIVQEDRLDELAEILGLNGTDLWQAFRKSPELSDQARMQFLIDIIADNLDTLLYHEPKLMRYYESLSLPHVTKQT